MIKSPNKFALLLLIVGIAMLSSCSKGGDTVPGGGNSGGGGGNSDKDTGCVISVISQVNSGTGTESSLSAFYNNKNEVTNIRLYVNWLSITCLV